MDEASRCDRIALMREGEFIATDTPQGIINSYSQTLWAVETENMSASLRDLRKHPQVLTCFAFGDKHHITVKDDLHTEELKKHLTDKGYRNVSISPIQPTVEDCFMALAN